MSAKINALQEKINTLKDKQTAHEAEGLTLAEQIQQTENELAAETQRQQDRDKKLVNAETRKKYEALEQNINARLESAQQIDSALHALAELIRTHLALAGETETLLNDEGEGRIPPGSGKDHAQITVSDVLRFVLTGMDLPGLGAEWVAPAERPTFTVLNKEKARLEKFLL